MIRLFFLHLQVLCVALQTIVAVPQRVLFLLLSSSIRFLSSSNVVPTEVPSTLPSDPVVAHSHADPVEESAVDTQSDDPFQFDDPLVPAPVILSQSNPVYDHRDDLQQHIRTQLQSRIRKTAQILEPDAKRLRSGVGKRAVLMLSHDVSSGPECCKPVAIFKSCGNSGCADVLLTRRAANKEV